MLLGRPIHLTIIPHNILEKQLSIFTYLSGENTTMPFVNDRRSKAGIQLTAPDMIVLDVTEEAIVARPKMFKITYPTYRPFLTHLQ